ncbi:hypothetical protein JI435_415000 [Parastagonospora nodorum SN15]|uniref:Uncharacterized protein n=1 Tax=Phaeosphaeria nodorum (strain SN15 / ATCC MYA-4574 / FGSC 10173) TaxID=321614 RepID=A0A7U2I3C9_PHANO|nr:hypothetical protein JI435_415000 [Parastagonospora nodorum SN15]
MRGSTVLLPRGLVLVYFWVPRTRVSECEPNHIMLKLDHQNLVCS